MPTPKPRSSFLPIMLIIVGLVVVAGVVVAFVPLVECEACGEIGFIKERERPLFSRLADLPPAIVVDVVFPPESHSYICYWCEGSARSTVWKRIFIKLPPRWGIRNYLSEEAYLEFLAARQSTP